MPRAAHSQPSLPGASSAPSAPSHNSDEMVLNKAALAQLSKAVLGIDLVQKHDEIANQLDAQRGTLASRERYVRQLSALIVEKQQEIDGLEVKNKDLRESMDKAKRALQLIGEELVDKPAKRARME
ncbi:hypothetical protein B0H12DRAFT_1237052 [Mycena haematopus]|nr:hypothetical protein B0H12DRAFT_1237052 [Mycena haematopus]